MLSVTAAENDSISRLLEKSHGKDKVNLLNNLAFDHTMSDVQSAESYAKKAGKLALKLSYQKGYGNSLLNLSYIYEVQGKNREAYESTIKALEIYEKINNKSLIAESHNSLGAIYSDLSDYENALEHYEISLRIYRDLNDTLGLANLYNNIGLIYARTARYDQALDYYNDALEIYRKVGGPEDLSTIFNNIGLVHLNNDKPEKALDYFKQVEDFSVQLNETYSLARVYSNMGIAYRKMTRYDLSLNYLKRSLKFKKETKDLPGISSTYHEIASVHFEMGNSGEALEYFHKSLTISQKIDFRMMNAKNYLELSRVHDRTGNFRKAYEYYRKHNRLNDSILSDRTRKKMQDMKIAFEVAKKDQQIKSLRELNEIQEKQITQQNITIGIAVVMVILAIISIVVIVQLVRTKRRENSVLRSKNDLIDKQNKELAELVATKDKFFSIIAHDLKNPISSFKGVTEMLHDNYDVFDEGEKKEMLREVKDNSKNVFELLENLLQWSRSQTGTINFNPTDTDIKMLIDANISLLQLNASKKDIELVNKVIRSVTVNIDANMIMTVIRNLVSNAVKFTDAGGSITLSAEENGKNLVLKISDTGVGINPEQVEKLFRIDSARSTPGTQNEKGTGLGLIICKEFTELNGGELKVESEKGIGTTFSIVLAKEND